MNRKIYIFSKTFFKISRPSWHWCSFIIAGTTYCCKANKGNRQYTAV